MTEAALEVAFRYALVQRPVGEQMPHGGDAGPPLAREGSKQVHGWAGEESLVRYPDGTQEFEWLFIGASGSIARPARLNVTMHTKVASDRVGAAAASSLNDEEAIALWDKLLEGLKFRVAVPGAPAEAVAIKQGTY